MKLATPAVVLLCLASVPCFAARWTGALVDSACYELQERDAKPNTTLGGAYASRYLEIRGCRPTAQTKSFMIVQSGGVEFKLDGAGNAKAAQIVHAGSQLDFVVTITGVRDDKTIHVESMSLFKQESPR